MPFQKLRSPSSSITSLDGREAGAAATSLTGVFARSARSSSCCSSLLGDKERDGAIDLIDDLAVLGVEGHARGGDEGVICRFFHQILADRENVLAQAIGLTHTANVLCHLVDGVLHVLRIG